MASAAQNPALQQPALMVAARLRKVFDTIAEKMGITNIGRYYMNVNVVPDEEAMAQEQAGNSCRCKLLRVLCLGREHRHGAICEPPRSQGRREGTGI